MINTQLAIAQYGHEGAAEAMDVQNSCWRFMNLLWKLDLIRYHEHELFNNGFQYCHQKDMVEMLWLLYRERRGFRKSWVVEERP